MTTGSLGKRLTIHIGHHFFGAGNIGDDLMLAGFERAARPFLDRIRFTCCIPHDRASQIRRFPFIQWLRYDWNEREASVAQCDAWLGLGDSPFQAVGGPWFLDHLRQELQLCVRHRRPMYYLGVGVNDRQSLGHPHTPELLEYARRIWTRDAHSLGLLFSASPACRAVEGADLANIELAARPKPHLESDEIGFVLNFEALPSGFVPKFCAIVEGMAGRTLVWIRQETRGLQWSESTLMHMLPASIRKRFTQREADYSAGDVEGLLATLSGTGSLVTSRYHAALAGAWQGSRMAVFCRNEKLTGLVRQFGTPTFDDFSLPQIEAALGRPQTSTRDLLAQAAARAERSTQEFFAAVLC
jgi:polysaccharide pyruvyl transferase WcaK-like protein